METTALIPHILNTHHALLKRELPRLSPLLHAGPVGGLFFELQQLLETHLWKEETILFPAIQALLAGQAAGGCGVLGPIQQMQAEHEQIRDLESKLREKISMAGPAAPALVALLDDLAVHAHLEDTELFPLALHLERRSLGAEEEAPSPKTAPKRVYRQLIRQTRGVCPDCGKDVAAEVFLEEGSAYLGQSCPEHGQFRQALSRHGEEWAELDRFFFSVHPKEHPQRDFIVRMTERCNLACPICLAKANTEDTPDLDITQLQTFLTEHRGVKIDLMAAEPTLREDLDVWIRRIKQADGIAALHTNGLKLADLNYAKHLKDAGLDEVFLQFDGLDDKANMVLRGRPLLKTRLAALKNMKTLGISTSLIVVIARGVNEAEVGRTLEFALQPENSHIREVFYMGLRMLGSARHTGTLADAALMPDDTLDLLCAQQPRIDRANVRAFNKLYFAMLSAAEVRKCLYVQHYMLVRNPEGWQPIHEILNLKTLAQAADRYAARYQQFPRLAKAGLLTALAREGARSKSLKLLGDFIRLEQLFQQGMNLKHVPERFLLIGFITACDPANYDAAVSLHCGKGELSADGGEVASGADANVRREQRFDQSDRVPGPPATRLRT